MKRNPIFYDLIIQQRRKKFIDRSGKYPKESLLIAVSGTHQYASFPQCRTHFVPQYRCHPFAIQFAGKFTFRHFFWILIKTSLDSFNFINLSLLFLLNFTGFFTYFFLFMIFFARRKKISSSFSQISSEFPLNLNIFEHLSL